ncbi:MAG: ethylbenzene dehydrogenase-related protein [Candidatus Omnitrophica bacterium]|nr:ethylbenzene dehydrogenase-related protein [Candidatus Omnitrophota bacterium]
MKKRRILYASLLICLTMATTCFADQAIVAKKVAQAPAIDGSGADEIWAQATEYVTYDKAAKINITLKAAYTDTQIFFLVSYPDADKSDTHKTWEWDKTTQMYKSGFDREDTFVFKWNMEAHPVDLSLQSDDDYTADIWFWKACRNNLTGYADDKVDRVSSIMISKSAELKSRNGKKMYMVRKADSGMLAYNDTLYEDYKADKMPAFVNGIPTGSSADIKAKGVWAEGRWTIEFCRSLDTGNDDDVKFDTSKTYLFGVSRYEIAGREPDSRLTQPLYGCGDVSEALTLKFEG